MTGDASSKRSMAFTATDLDPGDVESFLRDNPEFFLHRPELLADIRLPHGGAGSVSLVERQVALLRERDLETRGRLAELTQNAEASETLFEASRRMVIAVLDCRQLADLDRVVEDGLKSCFGVEYAAHIWLPDAQELAAELPACDADRHSILDGLLKGQRAYCGVFRQEEMTTLFPDCTSEGSAAIAPLVHGDRMIGVISVGSSDVGRYDSSVGTLFLEHLCQVITHLPCLGKLPDA